MVVAVFLFAHAFHLCSHPSFLYVFEGIHILGQLTIPLLADNILKLLLLYLVVLVKHLIYGEHRFFSMGNVILGVISLIVKRLPITNFISYLGISMLLESISPFCLIIMHFLHKLLLSTHILNVLLWLCLFFLQFNNSCFKHRLLIHRSFIICNSLHHFTILNFS